MMRDALDKAGQGVPIVGLRRMIFAYTSAADGLPAERRSLRGCRVVDYPDGRMPSQTRRVDRYAFTPSSCHVPPRLIMWQRSGLQDLGDLLRALYLLMVADLLRRRSKVLRRIRIQHGSRVAARKTVAAPFTALLTRSSSSNEGIAHVREIVRLCARRFSDYQPYLVRPRKFGIRTRHRGLHSTMTTCTPVASPSPDPLAEMGERIGTCVPFRAPEGIRTPDLSYVRNCSSVP